MMYLVYIRIPTNKVVVVKHMTAHKMIHFSREYGSTKSGIKPGGGRMLGVFARTLAFAILYAMICLVNSKISVARGKRVYGSDSE